MVLLDPEDWLNSVRAKSEYLNGDESDDPVVGLPSFSSGPCAKVTSFDLSAPPTPPLGLN